MIKECSGCERPAVGFVRARPEDNERPGDKRQLVCPECMQALLADGHGVEFFNPRHDLVAAVRERIRTGVYDSDTYEGSLATALIVDRLMAEQEQRGRLRLCQWSGHRCALKSCDTGPCFLDTRYKAVTDLDPERLCEDPSVPEAEECIRCDRTLGHVGRHANGWGGCLQTWGVCGENDGHSDCDQVPLHDHPTCGLTTCRDAFAKRSG